MRVRRTVDVIQEHKTKSIETVTEEFETLGLVSLVISDSAMIDYWTTRAYYSTCVYQYVILLSLAYHRCRTHVKINEVIQKKSRYRNLERDIPRLHSTLSRARGIRDMHVQRVLIRVGFKRQA